MIVGRSLEERPKSMLAMSRVATSAEGMPIDIPNSASTRVSRSPKELPGGPFLVCPKTQKRMICARQIRYREVSHPLTFT